MAGALVLSGCASVDSVKHAQATADEALSQAQAAGGAAQRAQSSADAAMSAAQAAGTAAQRAQSTADAAAGAAQAAQAAAGNANSRIDQFQVMKEEHRAAGARGKRHCNCKVTRHHIHVHHHVTVRGTAPAQ